MEPAVRVVLSGAFGQTTPLDAFETHDSRGSKARRKTASQAFAGPHRRWNP